MRTVQTSAITKTFPSSETERLWVYNGLDCCVTLEVLLAIESQLDNVTRATYEFSKSLQAPVLEMNMRGTLIDQDRKAEAIRAFQEKITKLSTDLNYILVEGLGVEINYRSHVQLKDLFYNRMGIPPVRKRNTKGELAPTVDREALEKLQTYFNAEIICSYLLLLRDLEKKVSALKTEVDPDGRMRTSYNIGGTTTGRFSSSESIFGTGGNLQNLEEQLRAMYVADPGMKLAYVDLEQAESRLVGAIIYNTFGDSKYLDACEGGDLHTYVCRLTYPEKPWTGDLKKDKELAEVPFYRQHSLRHMAKVLGHGSSYMGTPPTMAKHTKFEVRAVREFQTKFFMAFPGIPQWHEHVRQTLRNEGRLTSLMGRRRSFFGRLTDETTVREAVAYDPQSSVADILNTGLLNLWRAGIVQILMQIHDALLIQYPEADEDIVLPQVQSLLRIPVELRNNRKLIIPSDVQVGWNWSKRTAENPDGLIKFRGHDDRKRSPKASILDTIVYRV